MKWNEMRRNYSVMHISLFHCSIIIVKSVLLSVWCISRNSAWVEQFLARHIPVSCSHGHSQTAILHFLIIVQLTDSQLLLQQPNQMICRKVWLLSTTVPPHMTHIKHNSCCSSFTGDLWMGPFTVFFIVLLTIHLSIILAINQLNA